MTLLKKAVLPICLLISSFTQAQDITNIEYNDTLLQEIRLAATTIPGKKPNEIRYIKFAESPRTFAQTVEGGNNVSYIQARTAYQVLYGNEYIMIDSGMDKLVHNFFGMGKGQPYFQSANDSIQVALIGARKIIITHEHGDHVAGVLRSANYTQLAPKTLLTAQMANTLLNKPQMPLLQLKKEQLQDFTIVDFQDILPVAPGMVLIKAPGHTPGEIMVYIQFENGKEYLVIGDVSWSYKGIDEKRQKPQDQIMRIGENAKQIAYELDWLNKLSQKNIQLLVNHDNIVQPQLAKQGIIQYGLTLPIQK